MCDDIEPKRQHADKSSLALLVVAAVISVCLPPSFLLSSPSGLFCWEDLSAALHQPTEASTKGPVDSVSNPPNQIAFPKQVDLPLSVVRSRTRSAYHRGGNVTEQKMKLMLTTKA